MAKPKWKPARMTAEEFHSQNRLCGWDGCTAVATSGELPGGWICVGGYRGPATYADLAQTPSQARLRDCVICPEHAEVFERLFQPPTHRMAAGY